MSKIINSNLKKLKKKCIKLKDIYITRKTENVFKKEN